MDQDWARCQAIMLVIVTVKARPFAPIINEILGKLHQQKLQHSLANNERKPQYDMYEPNKKEMKIHKAVNEIWKHQYYAQSKQLSMQLIKKYTDSLKEFKVP